MDASAKLLFAGLCERTNEAHNSMRELLHTIGMLSPDRQPDVARARQLVEECIQRVEYIFGALAKSDRPPPLAHALSALVNYKNNGYGGHLFPDLVQQLDGALRFNWRAADFESRDALNFDALFNEYRSQGKLDQAIDEIIACLRSILAMGETFDYTKKTFDDLTLLLQTVEISKKGSRASVESSLILVWNFFKTVFFGWNPALREIAEISEAVLKLGSSVVQAHQEIAVVDKRIQTATVTRLRGPDGMMACVGAYDDAAAILPPLTERRTIGIA